MPPAVCKEALAPRRKEERGGSFRQSSLRLSSPPSLFVVMAFSLRTAAPLRATTARPARKAAAPARALAGDGARVDRSKKTDVM